jgi:DNA-directed RNA polymerase subunit RPC12/RpoP
MPVRKCQECGAGIIVRPKFLIFGARGEHIPEHLWVKMDRYFQREVYGVDPEKRFACSECGKRFVMQSALDNHVRDAHRSA